MTLKFLTAVMTILLVELTRSGSKVSRDFVPSWCLCLLYGSLCQAVKTHLWGPLFYGIQAAIWFDRSHDNASAGLLDDSSPPQESTNLTPWKLFYCTVRTREQIGGMETKVQTHLHLPKAVDLTALKSVFLTVKGRPFYLLHWWSGGRGLNRIWHHEGAWDVKGLQN